MFFFAEILESEDGAHLRNCLERRSHFPLRQIHSAQRLKTFRRPLPGTRVITILQLLSITHQNFQIINEYNERLGFWFVTLQDWKTIAPHLVNVAQRGERFGCDLSKTTPLAIYLDNAELMWKQVTTMLPTISKVNCKIDPWHFLERCKSESHSWFKFSPLL